MNPKQQKFIRVVCFVLAMIMIAGMAYMGVSLFMASL